MLKTRGTSLFTALLQRDAVKAMTLTQPWATLMAVGEKRVETRSWQTDYRGPLAIHAAKGFPQAAEELCEEEPFCRTLEKVGYRWRPDRKRNAWALPVGQIVAVGWLDRIERITKNYPVAALEKAFGDYTSGRYAWHFESVYRLRSPLAVGGSLGLWSWQPPDSFWMEIQAQHEQEVNA